VNYSGRLNASSLGRRFLVVKCALLAGVGSDDFPATMLARALSSIRLTYFAGSVDMLRGVEVE
jgi:hypothetical protein